MNTLSNDFQHEGIRTSYNVMLLRTVTGYVTKSNQIYLHMRKKISLLL